MTAVRSEYSSSLFLYRPPTDDYYLVNRTRRPFTRPPAAPHRHLPTRYDRTRLSDDVTAVLLMLKEPTYHDHDLHHNLPPTRRRKRQPNTKTKTTTPVQQTTTSLPVLLMLMEPTYQYHHHDLPPTIRVIVCIVICHIVTRAIHRANCNNTAQATAFG